MMPLPDWTNEPPVRLALMVKSLVALVPRVTLMGVVVAPTAPPMEKLPLMTEVLALPRMVMLALPLVDSRP